MSKSTHLLVYNSEVGTYDQVKNFIDSQAEILNWHVYLPYTFFLVSELSAKELSELFFKFTKKRGRFFILNATETKYCGWLPRTAWDLISHPKAAGE